jgi:ERCC4-type nuclease
MRRELAKREIPKKQQQLTKPFTLSDASRLQQIDYGRARRDGRIEGMDRMYQVTMTAIEKIKGIGPKRRIQIRDAILSEIIEIGKENGVLLDGLLDTTAPNIGSNQQAAVGN